MLNAKQKKNYIILCTLVIIAVVIKCIFGFDTDEQYSFTMMYRFSQGALYIHDVSDAYQFSALLLTPLYMFSKIIFPSNPVLAFRIISLLLKLLAAIPVYRYLHRKTNDAGFSILGVLCWFTMFPKSIVSLEHSNLSFILISYLLIAIDQDHYTWKNGIQIGALHSLLVLVYPPMLLLAFFFVPWAWIRGKRIILPAYLLISVLIASAFCLPIMMKYGITGFLQDLQLILMDGSHSGTAGTEKYIDVFKTCIVYAVKIALVTGFVRFGDWVLHKRTPVYLKVICSVPFVLIIFQLLFQNIFPLYDYTRYLLILIIYAALAYKRKLPCDRGVMLMMTFVIALVSSNNGVMANSGYVMPSILLIALLFFNVEHKRTYSLLFLSVVLISQCATMTLSFRRTSSLPSSIRDTGLARINAGVPGLYGGHNTKKLFENFSEVNELLDSQNVIFVGRDVYAYVLSGKTIIAPTTSGTPSYDEQWKEYLNKQNIHDINVIVEHDDIDETPLINILAGMYDLKHFYNTENGYSIYSYETK